MEAYSISRFNRISTKKLRRISNAVRKLKYNTAIGILENLPQKGARIMEKTLKSAGANLAYKEPAVREENWIIKEINVNQGPSLKRIRPRARGHADRINKPTSHLKIIISDNED